ncbi:MAG: xanthine dehydrogenase family protein molybdopterin-binding subunit [Granulosicoccus sp.]|nr:xanthine dehydrogenase family protein molybdopterin-binding subunit [Granulosicoccus sp.]
MNTVNVSRRRFLRNSAIASGGLVVGFSLTGCTGGSIPISRREGDFVPNAFIQITADNAVKFYCPRDEMGQGVMSGLATLVAEELDLDPYALELMFAGVHSDYTNPGMGVQATGGSNSMKSHYLPLRQAAADTRAVLIQAAAKNLGVSASQISTDEGHIVAKGERYPYGKFAETAAQLDMPADTPLKPENQFKYIGKDIPRLDAIAKATGTAEFGIDADLPGMVHAVVVRSPVAGAKLVSVDKTAASNMPGVSHVLEISSGLAVVASKYWQAKKAAAALDPQWEEVPLSSVSSAQVRSDYEAALNEDEGLVEAEQGDLAVGFAQATEVVESDYWAPYLAHAPLEPMNAVLKIENGKADLWSGTQGPIGAEGIIERLTDIAPENITIHSSYLGGGFGRRATLTHIVEITEIAQAINKPVQLLWSREDDMRHSVYRPACLMRIKAGVDADGIITTWDARRAGGNITPETLKNLVPALLPNMPQRMVDWTVDLSKYVFTNWMADHSSIEGLYEDYDFANRAVTHITVDHDFPLTFWRSVGHSYTAFATESMIDELAETAGIDPVEFRLKNTNNNPRLQNVIKVAGERMRQMRPAEGRYLGFAAHNSFATDVAEIAEVSVENGQIRVHKVTCVVDCGTAVTPDIVRAQMESSVMFGLTAVLHGKIELENGAVRESNFHDYPILRMNEAPEVEVIIVDSGTEPTGVGEPGLPPVAPAVANAVYRATGQRLQSLPLQLQS